jgi:UDP-GlcNAc:undecaprenyl-phosphate GlcNAc-1-phosphate transferase
MAASTVTVTTNLDLDAITGAGGSGSPLGASGLIGGFIPILLPFAILIVPLLDFVLAVFRRLRAGKSPFSADRKHLHHRLLDMGHTHFHAVLIFYAWTAVVSASGLLFLFVQDARWAVLFLVVGLIVCTILTLAPLSRRKVVEAAVQNASEEMTVDAKVASFDPLDAASDALAPDAEQTDAQAKGALERLQEKEGTS